MHKRFLNFFNSCLESPNSIVRACAALAVDGSQSPSGNSLSRICEVYGLDRECLPTRIRQANRDPPGPRAATIRDFLHMREMDTDVESVDDIIEYLCTYWFIDVTIASCDANKYVYIQYSYVLCELQCHTQIWLIIMYVCMYVFIGIMGQDDPWARITSYIGGVTWSTE